MEDPVESITGLAASANPTDRLRALQLMRERIEGGHPPTEFFSLARALIADPHNDCRWQATIVVGESVEVDPESVWDVICEHGTSPDEDMRDAVATVLLEHLLERHFDVYFPRLKERIESGAPLLADTLRRCFLFGQAVPHKAEIDELAAHSGR